MTTYKAVVEKVILHGHHGPYAVASCDQLEGSVTFGLTEPVWKEKEYPEPGTIVMLEDIRRKRAGWRANSGRFFQPADEPQPQPSNKQQSKQ